MNDFRFINNLSLLDYGNWSPIDWSWSQHVAAPHWMLLWLTEEKKRGRPGETIHPANTPTDFFVKLKEAMNLDSDFTEDYDRVAELDGAITNMGNLGLD